MRRKKTERKGREGQREGEENWKGRKEEKGKKDKMIPYFIFITLLVEA